MGTFEGRSNSCDFEAASIERRDRALFGLGTSVGDVQSLIQPGS